MTLEVRLLSAFVRKVDIAKHYPGGCPEFEQRHVLGNSDTQLYSLVAMSPKDLEASLQDIVSAGFQADQFCAVADMWHGPIQSVPTIQFHCQADTFPPVWFASAAGGSWRNSRRNRPLMGTLSGGLRTSFRAQGFSCAWGPPFGCGAWLGHCEGRALSPPKVGVKGQWQSIGRVADVQANQFP